MKEEKQLELDLDVEKEHTMTFTESELNTISLLCSFVKGDKVVNSIHKKLARVVDESFVEEMLSDVIVRQDCVEDGSHILPRVGVGLYENGYVLKILD